MASCLGGPLFCLQRQIEYDCVQRLRGTYDWTQRIELDANGEEVSVGYFGICFIENRYTWTQVTYDPENGSADPIEICTGPRHQPGTCWEP